MKLEKTLFLSRVTQVGSASVFPSRPQTGRVEGLRFDLSDYFFPWHSLFLDMIATGLVGYAAGELEILVLLACH